MLARAGHTCTTLSASAGLLLSNLKFYVSQAPDILIVVVACAVKPVRNQDISPVGYPLRR
jgi:hypothetical protein